MQEHLTYRVAHRFPVPANGRPTALAINPEGTFIAVGCASGGILIWCLNTCDLICRGSPPVCACGGCATTVTSMMWLEGGTLFFGRCNGLMGVMRIGKRFIEGTCLAAHDHLPICDMAYSEAKGLWAVATHNEIAFIQWKLRFCFYMGPEDRIIAKKISVISEEEKPVSVASLAWIRGGIHLLVSFINHHAEIIDGKSKNVLAHVAIHTPVSLLSPCQKKVLVTNASQELTVYDLESAHVLSSIRNVQSMTCNSPATYVHDGNAILVGCNDGQARLYDSDLSSCIQTLDHGGHGDVIAFDSHAFKDPDHFLIVTVFSGNADYRHAVYLWNTVEQDPLALSSNRNGLCWSRIATLLLLPTVVVGLLLLRFTSTPVLESLWITEIPPIGS